MMRPKHYTIPVFIPMEACPFQCIFCDQEKISGHINIPDKKEIDETIESYLLTIPENAEIQVGFFGGTFTGLKPEKQKHFLDFVKPFIESGKIKSIRLSTRPDFIDDEILEVLKSGHVETIELGAQSMDNEVLKKSGRGHTAEDTERAARLISDHGFRLGLQMMIGLPGDDPEKDRFTAVKLVELGARDVRIYPALVIRGTPLEKLYHAGRYTPLSLEEAVNRTADIFPVFEHAGVNIIRTGLHPSEGLLDKSDLVAGPFHVSFKELVLSKLWNEQLKDVKNTGDYSGITIFVPQGQVNAAVGYRGKNRKMFLQRFDKVVFKQDDSLKMREYYVDYH